MGPKCRHREPAKVMYAEHVEWSWPGALQACLRRAFPTQRVLLLETTFFPNLRTIFNIYVVRKLGCCCFLIILFSKWDLRVILREKKRRVHALAQWKLPNWVLLGNLYHGFQCIPLILQEEMLNCPSEGLYGSGIVERASDQTAQWAVWKHFSFWFLGQIDILSDEAEDLKPKTETCAGYVIT